MTIGIGLLVVSLIEELINVRCGRKPIYQLRAEAAHSTDDEDNTGAGADLDRKD